MRIIIGCEESQAVCMAFRAMGHDAFSCDIIDCSGGHPEWHIKDDILNHLDDGWDIMISHPPCKYLTTTANRSFYNNPGRWQKRVDAMIFVWNLMNANIKKICIENPKSVIVSHVKLSKFGKPQYIHPYQFGDPVSKQTSLHLKNLPKLKPTKIIEPEYHKNKDGSIYRDSKGSKYSNAHYGTTSTNNPENAKLRAKTYQGIADAMAEQWG